MGAGVATGFKQEYETAPSQGAGGARENGLANGLGGRMCGP